MLELQDLEGLNVTEIIALLSEEESGSFEIYIPKETQESFSTNENIAINYARLAYVGQQLSNIARSFEYSEVSPSEHESVLFTVGVADLQQLAKVLLELSHGYVNDSKDEEYDFDEDVEEFLVAVEEGRTEAACPYFIEVYNEYMTKEDDGEQQICLGRRWRRWRLFQK